MTDLTSLTIAEAREGLASKSFTAAELTDAHLAAIEAAYNDLVVGGMAAADFMFKDFVQNDYLGLGLRDAALFDRLPRIELNTGVNLRGEYSSEPRALIRQRWSPTLSTLAEINLVRDDHFARVDWRTEDRLLLSTWWASRRREGFALPVSGALGADVRWVLEFD